MQRKEKRPQDKFSSYLLNLAKMNICFILHYFKIWQWTFYDDFLLNKFNSIINSNLVFLQFLAII